MTGILRDNTEYTNYPFEVQPSRNFAMRQAIQRFSFTGSTVEAFLQIWLADTCLNFRPIVTILDEAPRQQ